MNAAQTLLMIRMYQEAFMTITDLQLTSHKYPNQAIVNDGDVFDYIVVGLGTAGSVMATRLAQNSKNKVLGIEAGGEPPLESNIPRTLIFPEKSRVDWKFVQQNDKVNQKCSKSRKTVMQGKMLGGTSGLGYLHYEPGSYKDYNNWADIVNDASWNFKNIQAYINKGVNIDDDIISDRTQKDNCSKRGPLSLTREKHCEVNDYLSAYAELGYKVVPELSPIYPTGYAPQLYTINNYNSHNTADAYLSKSKHWDNLKVLKNSLVIKIIFDDNCNAVAVKIKTDNNIITVKARNEIIICAGAVNSPKLLMISGIGPEEHLKSFNIKVIKDLPVGKNLQDRAGVLMVHYLKRLYKSPVSPNPGVFPAYVFTGRVDNHTCVPNHRTINYVNYPRNYMPYCAFTYEYCNKVCDSILANLPDRHLLWTLVTNLKPKSRGEILLKSADCSDPPLIYPNYLSNEQDIKDLTEIIKSYMKIRETEFFKRAGAVWIDPKLKSCKSYDFGTQEYWECYVRCMATAEKHYCGTCAMGSVVDSRLRVIGVKRLRVVDSSVIPEISSGGTLGPTVTIAEKAADVIKEDNKCDVDDDRVLINDYTEDENCME